MASPVDPEALSEWLPVFRDFGIVTVALFLLVYEAVFTTPNALVIGAAGSLLAAPAAMRIDARRRKRTEHDDDEEKWSHLP